jgi:hypothetical protein
LSISNRQRRQQKQRRRAARRAEERARQQGGWRHRVAPDELLMAAIDARLHGRPAEAERLLAALVADPGAADAVRAGVGRIFAQLERAGWDRELAAHVVRRKAGARAAAWVDGRGEDLRAAVDAFHLLHLLPRLPRIEQPVTAAAPGVDGNVLAKVRALLAKAESTDFPEEAEACTAKAQELMARHAIDAALLDGGGVRPLGRRVPIDDPYAAAKSLLLDNVANANRCRSIYSTDLAIGTVLGFERDLATVEILFTSLLVQATRAMLVEGKAAGRRARQRGFRQSFLVSFAVRIGQRLSEASTATTTAADAEHSGRLLPILARRAGEVDDEVRRMFPHVVEKSMSVTDHAGWHAGRVAADLADLAAGPGVDAR